MKQRIRYWSCSGFADWLRGSAKPRSETAGGWRDWETGAKARNPLRFWLAEEFLDKETVDLYPQLSVDMRVKLADGGRRGCEISR